MLGSTCARTHKPGHTRTRTRTHTHIHERTHERVCVFMCVRVRVRACVCAQVCLCPRVSESVRVLMRAGLCPRACAAVRQRPCGCVGFMLVFRAGSCAHLCARAGPCVCARARARVCACARSCARARASVFCRSLGKASSRMRVYVCACAYVWHACARAPRRLCGRCGGTAATGGINSPAGGAGRRRGRGCGSARPALGGARARPQV